MRIANHEGRLVVVTGEAALVVGDAHGDPLLLSHIPFRVTRKAGWAKTEETGYG